MKRKFPDAHELVKAIVDAESKRDHWVFRAQELLAAGNKTAARAALKRADFWEHQRRTLIAK